jgi:hypothetical protein
LLKVVLGARLCAPNDGWTFRMLTMVLVAALQAFDCSVKPSEPWVSSYVSIRVHADDHDRSILLWAKRRCVISIRLDRLLMLVRRLEQRLRLKQ